MTPQRVSAFTSRFWTGKEMPPSSSFWKARLLCIPASPCPFERSPTTPTRNPLNTGKAEHLPSWIPAHPLRGLKRLPTLFEIIRTQSRPSLEQAFDILGRVASHRTRWSIVYDNRGMKIHLRTDGNARIRTIDVAKFDFSCETPVKALDINDNLAGDVTHNFQNYDPKANMRLVKTSLEKLRSRFRRLRVTDQAVKFIGTYPQQRKCQE